MKTMFEDNMKNLCKLFGVKYPIIQGGMARISDHYLAASVSQKGGLGVIASGGLQADELETEIKAYYKLSKKPFAVNLALKNSNINELIQVVIDTKVPIIITGAGNPEMYMSKLKETGIQVVPVVSSVALAKRISKYGADAIIAEGSESGGHIGNTSTMCLVPQVVDAVNVPVIAAGGIADGRGMAAALMLGASGVQLGTRFLVSQECNAHANYKEKIFKTKDTGTIILNSSKVNMDSIRALKTSLTSQYLQLENVNDSDEKLQEMLHDALRKAAVEGDLTAGIFMAGQCAGMIRDSKTVGSIIDDIWEQVCGLLGLLIKEGC